MLTVYVKHYLTAEGIIFFKTIWFPKVLAIISQQPGFVSLIYTENRVHADCVDITLQFENEKTLNTWIAVPVHDELIEELDAWRSREYWEAVCTEQAQADPALLKWEIIKPTSITVE